jgi:hypothetical protein
MMKKLVGAVTAVCGCVGSVQAQIPVVGGPFFREQLIAASQMMACADAWQRFRARRDVKSVSVVDVAELVAGRGLTRPAGGVPAVDFFDAPPMALLLWVDADTQSGPKAAVLNAELPECAKGMSVLTVP